MKKQSRNDLYDLSDFVIRYLLIIIAGLGNLYIFYALFTPITIHAVSFLVNLVTPVVITGSDTIYVNSIYFQFVSACIGGSAYYLLFILGLSVRDLSLSKRVRVVIFSFVLLFVFNVLRIILMIIVAHEVYFTLLHWIFWYFLATVFVFVDWIIISKYFKIESIPVYSDLMFLTRSIFGVKIVNSKHSTRRRNKKKSKKR